jgi:hypothetical protein
MNHLLSALGFLLYATGSYLLVCAVCLPLLVFGVRKSDLAQISEEPKEGQQ